MKKRSFRFIASVICAGFLSCTLFSCKKAEETIATPISSPSDSADVFTPIYKAHSGSEGEFGTAESLKGNLGAFYYAVFQPKTDVKPIVDTLGSFFTAQFAGYETEVKSSNQKIELNMDYTSVVAGGSLVCVRLYGFLTRTFNGDEKEEENLSYAFVFNKSTGQALKLSDIFTDEGRETIRQLISDIFSKQTGLCFPASLLSDTMLQNALQFNSEGAVFLFPPGAISLGIGQELTAALSFPTLMGSFTESFCLLAADLLPKQGEIDPTKPIIALTFDDGPNKTITPKILTLLEQYDIHATFCLVGNRIAGKEEIVKTIISNGNEIANHTWAHAKLTQMSPGAAKESIEKTNQLVYSLTGFSIKFIRPPYGSENDSIREIAKELDMSIIKWSIDSEDWNSKDTQLIIDMCISNAEDGKIILCHDMYESTYEAMQYLIPYLIEQGYQFVTLSELFEYSGTSAVSGKVYRYVQPRTQTP